MTSKCQGNEYYDGVFSECFPCSSLCRRGEGATQPCRELCPSYMEKPEALLMEAFQNVNALASTPSPDASTKGSASFTVIFLIIATCLLSVILLLLILYISRRKYIKKMTSRKMSNDEENSPDVLSLSDNAITSCLLISGCIATQSSGIEEANDPVAQVHQPHNHNSQSLSNHSIQQYANTSEEQVIIQLSEIPLRSCQAAGNRRCSNILETNQTHQNSLHRDEQHLLDPLVCEDERQISNNQLNQNSNLKPQDHHLGPSSMVLSSVEYRTQHDGPNFSPRNEQHHVNTPLLKIPYQECGPSCQLDDVLSDAEECVENVKEGLPEKSYHTSLQTNMEGDRVARTERPSSGYSSMESDRIDVAKKSVKEVFSALDELEPCRSYFEDDGIIVIMVLFEMITYLDLIKILRQKTGWAEIDFRIRTYMPSRFELYSLVPGRRVVKRVSDKVRHRMAALGCYIKKKHQQDVYALSVAHVYNVGDKVYFDESIEPIGECVEVVKQEYPMHFDLAIIKLYDDHEAVDNIVFSAQGNPCTLQFPNEQQIQDKIQYKCQRKSNGTWQYCYFRYAEYTNKEVGLYRTRVCIRAHEACPVIRQGDCGCLLTSLPQSSNQLLVLGMLVGRVMQEAEDGGDPTEYYIAFNLEEALKLSTTFDGTGYDFCPGISNVHL